MNSRYIFTLFLFSLSTVVFAIQQPRPSIEHAVEKQVAAKASVTPEERQQLLNEALAIYLDYANDSPSGKLLNNIGDIYCSFGDFGMAICYYRRAQALMPRDPTIQKNIQSVVVQADVTSVQQERPLSDLIGFRWCSPLERASLAIGAIAFTFLFFSLNLWMPTFGFLSLWRISAVMTAIFLSALVWYSLFIPEQAVVVRAAPLQESPGIASYKVALAVVRPGEVVEVMSVDPTHEVVRVRTSAKTTGYIPGKSLFFID